MPSRLSVKEAIAKHFPYSVSINDSVGRAEISWLRTTHGIEADWLPRLTGESEILFENATSGWDYVREGGLMVTIFFFRSDKDAVEFKLRFG